MTLPEKMKTPILLDKEGIYEASKVIAPEWKMEDNKIIWREFKFPDFKKALSFTVAIGHIAEEENHHPDIFLTWGKVKVSSSTHSVGGLSNKDFFLAEKVDAEFATFV